MFDAALGLAPDWEKPAFCYAVYLDQLMVDARRRQLKLQDAQQQLLQKVRLTRDGPREAVWCAALAENA